MLTKSCFDRCMNTLLAFAEVEINHEKNKAFYTLMKNDFDDADFGKICEDICKTELLYGRYPAPKLFYDRKQDIKPQILIEVGSFYIDDTIPQYRAVLSDLDQEQRDKVCENVWDWLYKNKRGEMVSEDFIIERLKQFRPMQTEQADIITLSEVKKLIHDHNSSDQ